ncbi:hypothetical protein C0J52_07813 [Blattella germanica]|nr:hypothetical protein C0J52_07813 [Blattella germanica]
MRGQRKRINVCPEMSIADSFPDNARDDCMEQNDLENTEKEANEVMSEDIECGDYVFVNFVTEKGHDTKFIGKVCKKEGNVLTARFLKESCKEHGVHAD